MLSGSFRRASARVSALAVSAAVVAALTAALMAVNLPTAHAATGIAGVAVTQDGGGYAAISDTGVVHAYGTVQNYGSPAGFAGSITGIAVTADGRGYAAISSRGQVYAYGTVQYHGNPTGFTGTITGIAVTADGRGYVAVSSSGQVYAYGTVQYHGNPAGFTGTIVGIAVTADGRGYAAVSSHGQVYAYGTVQYHANPAGFTGTIAGIAVTADGRGYAAVSSSGQVYAYGTVQYHGNPYDIFGVATGLSLTASGTGYAVVTSEGQVHTYGPITYRGDYDDVAAQNSAQHLRAARYVNWAYNGSGFWNVDQTVSVVVRPADTYWSLNWAWTNTGQSSGGYMGLQTNGQRMDGSIGDTAIFSLWNANGSRGGDCGPFGGEGSGLSCRLPYTIYGDGSSYRLRVWREEADAQGQWWGAWIEDSRRGDVHIGDLRVPSNASLISYANDFSEYFGPRVGCDQVPVSVVNWAYPTANNGAEKTSFAQSLKASCTGGGYRLTTISGGGPVVNATLGGARPGS
jgi:hypothetical protein